MTLRPIVLLMMLGMFLFPGDGAAQPADTPAAAFERLQQALDSGDQQKLVAVIANPGPNPDRLFSELMKAKGDFIGKKVMDTKIIGDVGAVYFAHNSHGILPCITRKGQWYIVIPAQPIDYTDAQEKALEEIRHWSRSKF